jgi:hypothetical protein
MANNNDPENIGDFLSSPGTSTENAPSSDPDNISDFLAPKKAAKAAPSFDFAGAAKSFASNVLPGLAEIPQGITNIMQYGHRYGHPLLNPSAELVPDLSPIIDPLNKLAGAAPQPYLGAVQAMQQNPAMGFGQTPNQLMQQHPNFGTAGNFAGSLAAAPLLGPGIMGEAASKIPAITKLAPLAKAAIGSALGGGEFSAAQQGVENMNEQVTTNDKLNPLQAEASALGAFVPGAAMGLGFGLLGHGIPALIGRQKYAGEVKAAKAERLARQNDRIQARMGNAPAYSTEQKELLEAGKNVNPAWEQFHPGQLGPEGGVNNQVPPHGYDQAHSAPESGLPPGPTNAGADLTGIEPHSSDYTQRTQLEGKVEQLVDDKSQSWRDRRQAQARPATPNEKKLLENLARLAAARDKVAGKLAAASEQIERRLGLKPTARNSYIRPDLDDIRIAFIKEHGLTPKGKKDLYIEATLSRESMYPREFEFKNTSMLPKMKELEDLIEEYRLADANYERAKEGLTKVLPINDTIAVEIKDTKGSPRVVHIRNREQATGYDGSSELLKQYNELKLKLSAESGPYYDRTPEILQTLINKELKQGNATLLYLKDKGALSWLKSLAPKDQAKLILGISLTAAAMTANDQKAEAAPPPNIIGKSLVKLAKLGWEHAMGVRVAARVTATETSGDIIRRGYDATSRAFARNKRDAYLADMRVITSGAKELTEAEKEAVKNMSRADIMRTPALQGWTQIQRTKLADSVNKNLQYGKELQAEMARVQQSFANKKVPKYTLMGKSRYYRMLQHDLEDLGLQPGSLSPKKMLTGLAGDLFGSANTAYFWGNYRTAVFHLAEMMVAYASKHLLATREAVQGIITDPVFRKFCIANSPKGMFQRVLEGQEKFPWQKKVDEWINVPFDNAVKKLVGQTGYDALSAQLPERAKLGLGATITAVHNARTYPGGARAYMQDWIALAEQNKPVPQARQAQFAKIGVQNFIDDNKAIMFMPEVPISDRTVFQRHDLTKPFYPYLRAIVQQTRFFSTLVDDMMHAKTPEELGTALRTFLMGTVMVWSVTGNGVLPSWFWNVMSIADKQANGSTANVDTFRDAVDDYQKLLTGGIQMRDFGVKWFPYLSHEPKYWLTQFIERDVHALSFKDKQEIGKAVINTVAVLTINRVTFQGTQNLEYLRELVMKGIHGSEDYKRYNENWIMNKVLGRPFTGKVAEDKKAEYNLPTALAQWLFKIQTPAEGKVIKQGEKVETKQFIKDATTIGRNIRK